MPDARLKITGLRAGYHEKEILQGVSLEIDAGEVVALLGANGTGKTTLINSISGFIKPRAGTIELDGLSVTGLPPHRLFAKGIVQVSQERDLFPELNVADNLMLGGTMVAGDEAERLKRTEEVYAYFPRLHERSKQRVNTLSGGEQQMVAIGRALMGRPRLLLLDEPSGGLAPQFVHEIANIIERLARAGSTMLLVEQNIAAALAVADRVMLLRNGVITAVEKPDRHTGSDQELVRRLYF